MSMELEPELPAISKEETRQKERAARITLGYSSRNIDGREVGVILLRIDGKVRGEFTGGNQNACAILARALLIHSHAPLELTRCVADGMSLATLSKSCLRGNANEIFIGNANEIFIDPS